MGLSVSSGALQFVADIENSSFGATIRQMEGDLRRLTQTAKVESSEMENAMKKAALAIGGYLSFDIASDFAQQIVAVRGEFQKLEAVLTNSFGSNEMAKSTLGMLAEYASTTPFQLTEVANAFIKLNNTGFTPTIDQLTNLGDLAAFTNKSLDQVSEAVIDAQRGQFVRLEELTINAQKNGDKINFTFRGQTKEVENTSKAIQDYVVSLGQLNEVSGTTAAISATLEGQISNLKDKFALMLNALGQENEGAINKVIESLGYLVDHYQDVIDIIKVVAITYGTYRAAIIANTLATSGLTAAETLHYAALVIAEKAQKLLNLTMLTNPYVAAATAIATVVSALYVFSKGVDDVTGKAELLADSQQKMADSLAQTKATFIPYLDKLKDANISEKERSNIYDDILKKDPKVLDGLTAKTITYLNLSTNVGKYTQSLREQLTLEANRDATVGSIKAENEINSRLAEAQKSLEYMKRMRSEGVTINDLALVNTQTRIDQLNKSLTEQQKVTQGFSKSVYDQQKAASDAAKKLTEEEIRTIDVLNAKIAQKKKDQTAESSDSIKYAAFQKEIRDLEVERAKITGEITKEVKAHLKVEKDVNDVLQKRQGILDDLSNLHRDATQSGLTQETSELDKINEKYDLAIKKIQEFNKANPKNKITDVEIRTVGSDRITELNNAALKQHADAYKDNLDKQRDVFAQYEEAKKNIGIEKANQMFAGQTQGFDSYLDYLKSEQIKLVADVTFNGINVGNSAELKANSEQIVEAKKNAAKAAYDELAKVSEATQTFTNKRLQIEKQYQKDVATLQKSYTGGDLDERLRILRENQDNELTELKNNLARQGALYQKLNQDTILFSRESLKKRLADLKQFLKDGYITEADGTRTIITPEMEAALKSGIQQAREFLNSTAKVFGVSVDNLKEVEKYAKLAGQSLNQLAESVRPLNEGLANSLKTMGDMANVAGDAAGAFASFAAQDYAGGISSSVSAISGLVKQFTDAAKSAVDAKEKVADFQTQIVLGEFETTLQYRERARIQQDINDLKIEGLKKEQALLDAQKQQNATDFANLFGKIQKESLISQMGTERDNANPLMGILGLFTRGTSNTQELQSLAGKTFEDLEKLFNSGQLTDNAKALFEQLQKLKQEGVDIDKAIADARREAQQLFTGTTAENIADSIADGFASGFRSVEQFASKTEDIVRGAMLNALKASALEGPIKKIYDQFAIDAEDNGGLDTEEVANFTNNINKTIENATKLTEQIEKATGVSLSNATQAASGEGNSLAGAIKSITAQQADVLAGRIGGLALSNLEILDINNKQLFALDKIVFNTGETNRYLADYYRKWDSNGIPVIIR